VSDRDLIGNLAGVRHGTLPDGGDPVHPVGDPAGDPALIAIVGPTAAGKSELAIGLADALHAEIVNADSMQLYRGMDVGTAKPDAATRARPPHHLYDVWEISDRASVADYQRRARDAVATIRARGHWVVLVGGSGLYVRAVIDSIAFPATDPELRARLEEELADVGSGAMHRRLAGVDPAAAATILPSDGRRIVRALEVVEISGRPFSATLPSYADTPGIVSIGLDTASLGDRVRDRVDRMWAAGLPDEVDALARVGLRDGPTASRALGYRQLLDHIDGRCTLDEARERTVVATRQFARRQRSWFRRDPRISWLDAGSASLLDDALRRTLER